MDVLCAKVMRDFADILTQKQMAKNANCELATVLLKEEMKAEIETLIADMKEASDVFRGSGTVAAVGAVGCKSIAVKAFVRYQKEVAPCN